ncbi:hypothetical protein TNIN_88171 [Trichonephila inaurata madagascariensis]|uniref:Uncharacterized protein n=1 Tax=Trichonephila inaurata madagascariensis TaxID=2747483 RepID=A0A8X6XGP0_9ARAC|nr:hypothetical protein TNIN_88171 [Trichonephila inaurata madagascariensis]
MESTSLFETATQSPRDYRSRKRKQKKCLAEYETNRSMTLMLFHPFTLVKIQSSSERKRRQTAALSKKRHSFEVICIFKLKMELKDIAIFKYNIHKVFIFCG